MQNTRECHKKFQEHGRDFVETREVKAAVLKKGDLAILDARCLHAGGANVSTERRVLFYFTLRFGG
jgi:ectoine hydroxylase-related dioxygenase (phytanoyl-CoA dioxygenase family)